MISVDEEPVEVMNADSTFVSSLQLSKFDTQNTAATCISTTFVRLLGLEDRVDHKKRTYTGAAKDDRGQRISAECSTIEITMKVRGMEFSVTAYYDVTPEHCDLLIGNDVIGKLFEKGFMLGK